MSRGPPKSVSLLVSAAAGYTCRNRNRASLQASLMAKAHDDGSEAAGDEVLKQLFERYAASEEQQNLFFKMKKLTNMPALFHTHVDDEQILWAVLVGSVELSTNPTASDLNFCARKIEERLRNLEEAEHRFKWFSGQWTKPLMRQLIRNWCCGSLVISPDLTASSGSPIQFVREYYGDDIGYPPPEEQTEEWKEFQTSLYVLMARSTCLAYPMATAKGIVSFSDMQDFDWAKYDMESKKRNSDITQLVPNRLARMIAFHPDEKILGDEMNPKIGVIYPILPYTI